MKTLVIVDHNNNKLEKSTLNTVKAAIQLENVDLLVLSDSCKDICNELIHIKNINNIFINENDAFKNQLAEDSANFIAENFAPVVVKLANHYSHVICSANTFGKNLMPRIAAALDTSQISDIIKVISPDTFLRPIYAGNAFATVKSNDPKKCVTIRPTSFDPCESSGGSAPSCSCC